MFTSQLQWVEGVLYNVKKAICDHWLTLLSAEHLQMLQRQQCKSSLCVNKRRTMTSSGVTIDLTGAEFLLQKCRWIRLC